MHIVKQTKGGIEYLIGLLKQRQTTVSRCIFWKIHHKSGQEDISLKVGRYVQNGIFSEEVEVTNPRSELTLDNEEFHNLLDFLSKNYEPFKMGVKRYLPLDEKFDEKVIAHIKAVFDNPDKQKVIDFIESNNILPEDILIDLEHKKRIAAVKKFEEMLTADLVERDWQQWFQENSWVLCTDFVRIVEERDIDTDHIADYLMEAYDGFLDIVEIKRPEGGLEFWASTQDHGNYVPSNHLVKAIMQANRYIYELEREANSQKFFERMGKVKTIKPRGILIFGRSNNWNQGQNEAYRIFNSNFHNLTVLTYDHVLSRAKRILGINEREEDVLVGNTNTSWPEDLEDDLPF